VNSSNIRGETPTNQNRISKDKGDAPSCGAESFVFRSKNTDIKIYRTIILPVVLYGCKTWSLPPREECRHRVFENRMLRRIFGNTRDEITGGALDSIVTSLMIRTAHVLRCSNREE
jgi:hypothetical protein